MRGVDDLTIEELRTGRALWWDDAFTQMLVGALGDAHRIVDIGCGLGAAAAALQPTLPGLRYVGVDLDLKRLSAAAPGNYVAARAEALPFPDGAADAALFIAMLMHVDDPVQVLREARRVAPKVVAVEPDHLAQQFYFGGRMPGVTAASCALMSRIRRGDMAIGPRLPDLCLDAGFSTVSMHAYSVSVLLRKTAGDFAEWLRPMLRAVVDGSDQQADCDAAIDACRAKVPANPERHCGVVVPMFVTCAS